MCAHIDMGSLSFAAPDGSYRAAGEATGGQSGPQCRDACFAGEYLVAPPAMIERGFIPKRAAG